MRLIAILLLFIGFLSGTVQVSAQVLPNYVDPSARTDTADPAKIPAIRFLTTADFPPFDYRDANGKLVGFNIDLARAICAELKATCTIQPWPWDQAADALADNQGDALIAGLAINAQNGARFGFTDIYLGFPARFVTLKQNAPRFDPYALSGKTIAVRKGSAQETFAKRYLKGVDLAGADNEMSALGMVKSGKADAYFGDAMRAAFWLNENPECCAFAGQAYFRPDLFGRGMAIAVPAGSDSLRRALNTALIKLKRGGTMDELYLRWFPVSFY